MTGAGEGLHFAWARLIATSLASCGVSHVVLSPGSRSTPLAVALAEEEKLQVAVVVDERAAGFVALGQARVTGKPSVLVCTSGTAVAHYHPAVIEAEAAGVPLLVLSADRPLELQGTAASQTIDQMKIFGSHVRRYVDLGVPDAAALGLVPRMIAASYLAAIAPQAGPVHLNARFRRPLEPTGEGRDEAASARSTPALFLPRMEPSDDAVDALAARVREARSVLVAAGPIEGRGGDSWPDRARALGRSAALFARASGAAVLGEITSGLAGMLGSLAAMLDDAAPPDLVVQIGRPPVASRFGSFAASAGARVVVTLGPAADPEGSADAWIVADPVLLLARVAERLSTLAPDAHAAERRDYTARLARSHAALERSVRREVERGELTEPLLAYELCSRLPKGSLLLAGNSTPVRDLCAYGSFALGDATVLHQRGAAGIDGLFAGIAGTRLAAVPEAAVAALIGDVSALHDAGGLAVVAACPGPLVCVVADNRGGRIFEELPVARTASGRAHLERLFLTPPPPGALAGLASAFRIAHTRVTTRASLGPALDAAFASSRPVIVEVEVPAEGSRAARQRIRQEGGERDA